MAVDCLPRATRIAMLRGISTSPIIVGAYSDESGICPMLAAHRCGGRTSFISFARAWDRFAFREARGRRARRATERELLILRSHLEASLLADEGPVADLGEAIAEHRRRRHEHTQDESARKPSRPGDPDRSRELRHRPGWSWMRVVRRLDDYERLLARVESEQDTQHSPERESEPQLVG
ncbi:MAG: hypothetical protein ACYC91_16125 [Solirubrobacteraceae bacterium]